MRRPVLDEYRQAMEVRAALEGMAGRLAAARLPPEVLKELARLGKRLDANWPRPKAPDVDELDARFHKILAQSSGNASLCRLLDNQHLIQTCFSLQGGINRSYQRVRSRGAAHSAIVEALRSRAGSAAERAIREHILGTSGNVLDQWNLQVQDGDGGEPDGRRGRDSASSS